MNEGSFPGTSYPKALAVMNTDLMLTDRLLPSGCVPDTDTVVIP